MDTLDLYANNRIPQAVIERLPLYLRYLTKLQREGLDIISSHELGKRMGVRSSQIRKDFALFGEFGVRGMGYDTEVLLSMVKKLLGLEKTWNMAFLGICDLSIALSQYEPLTEHGFCAIAFFDDESSMVGKRINGIIVRELSSLPEVVRDLDIKMGVITLPVSKVQEGADLLVAAGVKGIWNFTPEKINVPLDVEVCNEDLSIGPLTLSYFLSR